MHRLPLWAKMLVMILLPCPKNERQRTVNDLWLCILDDLRAMERCYPIINSTAAFKGKYATNDIASASYN